MTELKTLAARVSNTIYYTICLIIGGGVVSVFIGSKFIPSEGVIYFSYIASIVSILNYGVLIYSTKEQRNSFYHKCNGEVFKMIILYCLVNVFVIFSIMTFAQNLFGALSQILPAEQKTISVDVVGYERARKAGHICRVKLVGSERVYSFSKMPAPCKIGMIEHYVVDSNFLGMVLVLDKK
jgi:hypothetical protein